MKNRLQQNYTDLLLKIKKSQNNDDLKLVLIFIVKELYKGLKFVLKISLIFLFLSIFIYNLEYQEFSGDYTKITKKSCIVQVASFNELIIDYFMGEN